MATLTTDAPPSHPELGPWVTRCGPKGKPSTFGMVILIFFMLVGVGSVMVGMLDTSKKKPGSESLPAVLIGVGGTMIGIGVLCLAFVALWKHPQVDLYAGGVRFKEGSVELFLPWAKMEKVKITTVYDTRFSHYQRVQISVRGRADLEFESKLQGEPERVIAAIGASAPNLEEDVVDFGA